MSTAIEQTRVVDQQNQSNDLPIENISMENANYLQNMEEAETSSTDESFNQENKEFYN